MIRSRALRGLLFASWSILGAALILALVEGALRRTDLGAPAEPGAPAWMDAEMLAVSRKWSDRLGVDRSDFEDLQGWRMHPTRRWSLEPDLEIEARNIFVRRRGGEVGRWTLRTNSQGFRTPEFAPKAAPGTFRVVTVGDSNTMGWLLDDADAYPRRLEAHLAALLGVPVEVVNLGVSGYTTESCRQLATTLALALAPDALVISCGANDTQQLASSDAEYARNFGGRLGGVRTAVAGTRLATLASRRATQAPQRARVSMPEFERNLEAMFRGAHERDIPVVFFRVCCCAPAYGPLLGEIAERHGIPVVHSAPEIRRALARGGLDAPRMAALASIESWYTPHELRSSPSLRYTFRDGCHLNALGADLGAEALAGALALEIQRMRSAAHAPPKPADPTPTPH